MIINNINYGSGRFRLSLFCVISASTLMMMAHGEYCSWDEEAYKYEVEDLTPGCCNRNSYDSRGDFGTVLGNTYSYANYDDLKAIHHSHYSIDPELANDFLHDGVRNVVKYDTIASWGFIHADNPKNHSKINTIYFDFGMDVMIKDVVLDIAHKEEWEILLPSRIGVAFSNDNVTYGMEQWIENDDVKDEAVRTHEDDKDSFPVSIDGVAGMTGSEDCMPFFKPSRYARVDITCHLEKSEKLFDTGKRKTCGISEVMFTGPVACDMETSVDDCTITNGALESKKASLRGANPVETSNKIKSESKTTPAENNEKSNARTKNIKNNERDPKSDFFRYEGIERFAGLESKIEEKKKVLQSLISMDALSASDRVQDMFVEFNGTEDLLSQATDEMLTIDILTSEYKDLKHADETNDDSELDSLELALKQTKEIVSDIKKMTQDLEDLSFDIHRTQGDSEIFYTIDQLNMAKYGSIVELESKIEKTEETLQGLRDADTPVQSNAELSLKSAEKEVSKIDAMNNQIEKLIHKEGPLETDHKKNKNVDLNISNAVKELVDINNLESKGEELVNVTESDTETVDTKGAAGYRISDVGVSNLDELYYAIADTEKTLQRLINDADVSALSGAQDSALDGTEEVLSKANKEILVLKANLRGNNTESENSDDFNNSTSELSISLKVIENGVSNMDILREQLEKTIDREKSEENEIETFFALEYSLEFTKKRLESLIDVMDSSFESEADNHFEKEIQEYEDAKSLLDRLKRQLKIVGNLISDYSESYHNPEEVPINFKNFKLDFLESLALDADEKRLTIEAFEEELVNKMDGKANKDSSVSKKSHEFDDLATAYESVCAYDYIYRRMEPEGRFPVTEEVFTTPIDIEHAKCPSFLCGKLNETRIVLFYDPQTDYAGSMNFSIEYHELARTMKRLHSQFHYPEIEFYAVSCCANQKLCADHIQHSDGGEYPTFKFIKAGENYETGISAHFEVGDMSGTNTIGVIEGVYKVLYPGWEHRDSKEVGL